MDDEDDDLIPLSALQHMLFCPRQCALIHVERQWAENRFTAEGRVLHDRTDKAGTERRNGVSTVTAMPIRSGRLRVAGIADVVELHGPKARPQPYPVEYKRGRAKAHRADEVQLCAQAICLEEMFAAEVAEGALYYGQARRRHAVAFDAELRSLTARVARETRDLLAAGRTPPPVYEPKRCDTCSLIDICQPKRLARRRDVAGWLDRRIDEA